MVAVQLVNFYGRKARYNQRHRANTHADFGVDMPIIQLLV